MFGMLVFLTVAVSLVLAFGLGYTCYRLGRKVENTKVAVGLGLGAWVVSDSLHKVLQIFGLVETSKNACSAKYRAQETSEKVDGLEQMAKQGAQELDSKLDRFKSGAQGAESRLHSDMAGLAAQVAELTDIVKKQIAKDDM